MNDDINNFYVTLIKLTNKKEETNHPNIKLCFYCAIKKKIKFRNDENFTSNA